MVDLQIKAGGKASVKAGRTSVKAVIFDVDGVLIDSKHANFLYVRDTLKHFGHREIKEEEYYSIFHKSGRQVIKTFVPNITEEELDEIREYQREVFPDYFKFTKLKQGIREILKFLAGKNILMGIVTNRTKSARKIIEFFEIDKYFRVVIGAHDVTNVKPHPEPVLKAVEFLGVRPAETIYVGDSDSDVQSANAAGAISVFYSDSENADAKFNISDIGELRKLV